MAVEPPTTSPPAETPAPVEHDVEKGLPAQSHPSVTSRVHDHLSTNVDTTRADLILLVCCFVSGLIDSGVFNVWGCFAGMQTGNTIIFSLGASNQPSDTPYAWAKSLVAVAAFCAGCFTLAQLDRALHPRRRGTLALTFLTQSALIWAAAALVQSGAVSGAPARAGPFEWLLLLPLALLAFQSSGQIVASRFLGLNEIPTIVLTSVYCDLWYDPKLWIWRNVKRNRRVGGVVALIAGAIAGGWISRSEGGFAAVLFLAAGLKTGMAVAWMGWKGERSVER